MRVLKFLPLTLSMLIMAACSTPGAPRAQEPSPEGEESTQASNFRLSEAMPPKVYRHASGITLNMVVLEDVPGEPAKALIQFTGTRFPTAGLIMLATATGSSQNQSWRVPYDGSDRVFVSIVLTHGTSSSVKLLVRLYMPQAEKPIHLQFHEEATREFDVEGFIARHLQHKASGALDSYAALDRTTHQEKFMNWLDRSSQQVVKHCGQAIPYEVDWASIADEQVSDRSPCARVLEASSRVCKRDEQTRRDFLKTVKKLRCSHSDKNEFLMQPDGTLQMNITYQGAMNRDTAYGKLHKLFDLGLTVLTDAKGRLLVFDPDNTDGDATSYLGDDKDLYAMRREANVLGAWDPYARGSTAQFYRRDGHWQVHCDKDIVRWTAVSNERRDRVIKNAKRHKTRWLREEFALARDNRGNYYYVDHYEEQFGGKNYRVFRGPRGQLEETTLVDIVDDSDGKIFATKRGQLRLVLGAKREEEALWIEGNKRHKLVVLGLFKNRGLIYSGLGVYDSEVMGSVCE